MRYALGLDFGVNSIGWAVLELNSDKNVFHLEKLGSRIFEPGMELDEKSGKADSRAAVRRTKHAARLLLRRRRRRIAKLRHLLQRHGMLPAEANFGKDMIAFDGAELEKMRRNAPAGLPDPLRLPHVLPYYLRARGLDYDLTPMEFGRAIYHLAQRRGFLSNRKAADKDGDDSGLVKESIAAIRREMQVRKARTLGEYFSALDPAKQKIRRQWAARDMFEDEFRQLCDRQAKLLTPELRTLLHHAIFFQRPLKSVAGLVGECELESEEKRCPWNRLAAQEFRVLQGVNHLRLLLPDKTGRELSAEERSVLLDALMGLSGKLDAKGDLTFVACRKLLKLPRTAKFSLELGGEKRLVGHKINWRLTQILGEKWSAADCDFQSAILQELRSIANLDALKKRFMTAYRLPENVASELSEYILPEGYCALSARALQKLLPDLREGADYSEAVKRRYPETFQNSGHSLDCLPPPPELKKLRNPMVVRILNESRKVVNALIDRYGKPEVIRIELARDVKNGEKERQNIIARNREQEKRRQAAYDKIVGDKTLGIANPRRSDIEKVLLAEECRWICPYTGTAINLRTLLRESQFDIEHILPYSRSMDNSFANKTLCLHTENRFVKKNDTPYEAYSNQPEKYEKILLRVASFAAPEALVAEKLRRFKIRSTEEFSGFSERLLNDTKYASKLVKQYLGCLYGGEVDGDGIRRVQAGSGQLTALIRGVCDFNRLLGAEQKNRGDHRHHAIDAVAIALSEPNLVQRVARFFSDPNAEFKAKRFWGNIREALSFPDWPDMFTELEEKTRLILSSHHVGHRLRGPLHNETVYSKPHLVPETEKTFCRHARVALENLSGKDVQKIVDHAIRKCVQAKLAELGKEDGKVFKGGLNLPEINGIPVKKVRIAIQQNTITVGQGDRAREVNPANNHHMELVDVLDADGKILRQEGYVVTLFEALRRKKAGEPIVRHTFPDLIEKGKKEKPDKVFRQRYRMVLYNGDILLTQEEKEKEPSYKILRSIPQSKQMVYVRLNDARQAGEIRASRDWFTAVPNTLLPKFHGKFLINYLGEPRRNNA